MGPRRVSQSGEQVLFLKQRLWFTELQLQSLSSTVIAAAFGCCIQAMFGFHFGGEIDDAVIIPLMKSHSHTKDA